MCRVGVLPRTGCSRNAIRCQPHSTDFGQPPQERASFARLDHKRREGIRRRKWRPARTRKCGRPMSIRLSSPRKRTIQYSRGCAIESRSRGVLDRPVEAGRRKMGGREQGRRKRVSCASERYERPFPCIDSRAIVIDYNYSTEALSPMANPTSAAAAQSDKEAKRRIRSSTARPPR